MRQAKRLAALILALMTALSTLSVTAWAADVEAADEPDIVAAEEISDAEEEPTDTMDETPDDALVGSGDPDAPDAEEELIDTTDETPDDALVGSGDPDAPESNDEETPSQSDAEASDSSAQGTPYGRPIGGAKEEDETSDEELASPIGGGGAAEGGDGEGDDAQAPGNAPVGSGDPDAPDAEGESADLTDETPDGFAADTASDRRLAPASGGTATYTVSDTMKAELKNGVLTISGTGDMPTWDAASDVPWASDRSVITQVNIKSGVTGIGRFAFAQCGSLTSVSIANGVTVVGNGAFYECRALESVSLPQSVKTLESGAFADCYSLKSVSMPGVVTVEDYAFQGTALTSVTLPKTLTDLGSLAFWNAGIGSYNVERGNSKYSAVGGVLYTDGGKTLAAYPSGKTGSTYTIPSTVTKVGDSAFANNRNLTQITIPNSVKSLGSSAFQSCTALERITIPDSVTEADYFTFYGCSGLTSVTFGKGLKSTSYEMFENCTSLTEINFGSGLTELYARTFASCTRLTDVVLPKTITTVGNACFGNCYSLQSFASKGLKEIPYQTFMNDYALTEVSLNEGVTAIYRSAFLYCSSLKQITLPKSVTYVASTAFNADVQITCGNANMKPFGINGYCIQEQIRVSGTRSYSDAFAVLTLVNEQRKAQGRSALVMDESLMETAMMRAAETSVLFAHTRPNGGSCFTANSLMRAENIAAGQTTPASAMTSWMNSQGHRENILNAEYTTIGIGCFIIDGEYYWVQCFGVGSNSANCAQPKNTTKTETVSFAGEKFDEANDSGGIIWGSPEEYSFTLKLETAADELSQGGSTEATCYLTGDNTFYPRKLNADDLVWSSSNKSVVTVSGGTIKAVGSGTAVVTAKTKGGCYQATVQITVKQLTTPALPTLQTAANGIIINWSKVSGAAKYRVFRKTGSGDWQKLGDTAGTNWVDRTAEKGKTYSYTICCISKDGKSQTSDYNRTGKSILYYLATPGITKLEGAANGVVINWNKVAGAQKYRIWRKTGSGNWERLGDASGTSWIDRTAKKGVTYTYTVRCMSRDGKVYTSAFDSAGKSVRYYLATPTITKLQSASNGVIINWSRVNGAGKYRIWRKTGNGDWVRLGDASGTSWIDRTAKKGVTYTYTVRCMTSDGKTYISVFDNVGKTVTR